MSGVCPSKWLTASSPEKQGCLDIKRVLAKFIIYFADIKDVCDMQFTDNDCNTI